MVNFKFCLRLLNLLVLFSIIGAACYWLFNRRIDIQWKGYDVRNHSFEKEYESYIKRHQHALSNIDQKRPKLIVSVTGGVGHGNRLPSMLCGFLYAMLIPDRIFLLAYPYMDYHDFPVDVNFGRYSRYYEGASSFDLHEYNEKNDWNDIMFKNLSDAYNDVDILYVRTFDYACAPIFTNPHYKAKLQAMFPSAEMFHPIASKLFKWSEHVQQLVDKELSKISQPYVGVHIRTKKEFGALPPVSYYCITAMNIASKVPGKSVFLATDSVESRSEFLKCFEGSNVKVYYVPNDFKESAANPHDPGSDISGLVDLVLLTKASDVIVTYSSSFGAVAAAIAGIDPVYITPDRTVFNEGCSFFKALSSEPCFYKSKHIMKQGTIEEKRMFQSHPNYLHHLQCHPIHE